MEEIANAQLSLMDDRGVRKLRVNIIGKNRIVGYLRPVRAFRERHQPPGGIP